MNRRSIFLISLVLLTLCPLSACKPKTDAAKTNETVAETAPQADTPTEAPVPDGIAQPVQADAQSPQQAAEPGAETPMPETAANLPVAGEPMKLQWEKGVGIIELDGLPTCVKPTCTCGSKTIQQYEKCIDGKPAKQCLDDKCQCGEIGYKKLGYDEELGVSPIPVYTYCVDDSELWCGKVSAEMHGVVIDELYHYLCDNGHWTYSMDPVDRTGGSVTIDTEEIKKAPEVKLDHVTVCKEGNCKCGEGACGKDAVCIKDKCYCGNLDQLLGGTAFTEETKSIDSEEQKDITVIESNEFGDFKCRWTENASEALVEYHAYYYCDRSDGCETSISKAAFPPESCSDGKSYLGPTKNTFFAETDFGECNISGIPDLANAKKTLKLQSNIETSNKNKSIQSAAMANLLNLCGRDSSANMKQDHTDYDAFYRALEPNLEKEERVQDDAQDPEDNKLVFQYDRLFWNNTTAFIKPYKPDDPEFSCQVRRVCDTWPVPRDKRNQYVCDIGAEDLIYIQPKGPFYDLGNDNDDYYKFYAAPKGLRCVDPNGCVCAKTTCPNQAICQVDECIYDSKYIRNTCGLTPLMKTQQAIELEIKNMFGRQKESGLAWDFPHKYMQMSNNTMGLSVSKDGACVCGLSTLKAPDLSQYTCDLVGYRCTSEKGCTCGSILCPTNAYCLKPDVCAVD